MASHLALRPSRLHNAYNPTVNSVPIVNNNDNAKTEKPEKTDKDTKITELAELISDHLTRFKSYHFRPVKNISNM